MPCAGRPGRATSPVPVTNLLGLTCAIFRRVVRGMGVCRHLARLRIRITTHRLAQTLVERCPIAADHDEPSTQPLPAYRCAMTALPRAGKGPGKSAQMTLVDPWLIAVLAIVVVVRWSRRSWPPPGRGCRETLPKNVPVPREAAYSETPEADRPAMPEWVVRDDSHDSVSSVACQRRRRNGQAERLRGLLVLPFAVPLV